LALKEKVFISNRKRQVRW